MCVCSLVTQNERATRIVLSSVVCLPLQFFPPYYLINGTIFGGKKNLLNIKCVF